jgi:small GTP-binding protein
MKILNDQQQNLLRDERKLLNDLQLALVHFGATPEHQDMLRQSIAQLDDLFMLVVVGEFNAGKSAFVNALLGRQVLAEGVTPTTMRIDILRYGPTEERTVIDEDQHIHTLPIDVLSEISIVDTPGTNAVIRRHEVLTSEFVPRSDLVLFITSADRPFTESERAFLERIRDWGKKVVIVVNKLDILETPEDLVQIREFIAENARVLLGITPEIFAVSARAALRAKLGSQPRGESSLWEASRFEPLERFIHDTLDERGRIRLKLLNPLGIGTHLIEKYMDVVSARQLLLKDDLDVLEDVENQLAVYKEDMNRDFEFRMADVENTLFEMERRGQAFFDETFRLARIFDLLAKDRVQREFEQQVVANAPQQIEHKIDELIDWLVDSDLRQWQAVTEYLAERRRRHQSRIVGDAGVGSFHYDRERLMEVVGREARRVIDTYDKVHEAQAIAEGAQAAVAASAAIEVGAVGLGTIITILGASMTVDVTGIVMAGAVAALGLFVIPARRRRAKTEMRAKVAAVGAQLVRSLRTHFEREIERSLQHINETIAPYTRFVRAEGEKMRQTQETLESIKRSADRLRTQIEEI